MEKGLQGIQMGGPRRPWPSHKIFISCCSKSLFAYHFSISEYQVGSPCSYVYLVQFSNFISLGSSLGVFRS